MASSKRSVITSSEIGDTGVQFFNGVITGEEYNRNLTGRQGLRIWDEMRRADATVGASLRAIKLPIRSTKFFMNPATDDESDLAISEYVKWNLFERLKWNQILGEILTHLEFGFSVHEMVFGVEIVEGVERIVLTKLAFRKQTSLEAWEAGKGVPGIKFRRSDGTVVSIPLEKIVVFTNEQEGDNYEGRSVLRTAYRNWFYLDKYYQIDAVGHERHSLGVVKIKYPNAATDSQRDAAKRAARNLRANEESFIEEPAGWDINFMDMMSNSLKDIHPSMDKHERLILVNVLAQFLNIGAANGSGTRSTSEDHHELLNQSVQAVLDYIKDTMGYVIKTLVDLNFNVDAYPTMGSGDIDQGNIAVLADALDKFSNAGMITPTEEDEAHVRNLLGLPERTDESTIKDIPKKDTTKKTEPKDKESAEEIEASRAPGTKIEASVSARDFPGLYDDTGVNPDDLGCIMLDVEPLDILKHVPADLHDDLVQATTRHDHAMGAVAETEAHVTLLYGLLENGNVWKEKVDTVLTGWSKESVEIKEVGYFETPDSFAVIAHVQLDEELVDGHERLTLLPHIQTFSEYKPHITLAYLNKDADVDAWVESLGAVYNGKSVAAKEINYGDLPEDETKKASRLKSLATNVSASLTRLLYGNDKK